MSRLERVVLALVFVVYCAATIAGAATHESWWDEAQAWLIARDAPIGDLLLHEVRYEGHPPLWFLILAIPAKLGLPYWWLKVAGVLCGATSVFLLLFAFPRVPVYIRVVAPFAFYIAYQYTVVARSYVLILPLLLLIARMYDQRHLRPGRFALWLILLSGVSVHGFAIACGLAGLYLLDLLRRRIPWPPRRAFLIASGAFVLNAILLVILLWPPRDNTSPVQSPFVVQRHAQVVKSIIPNLFWPRIARESPERAMAKFIAALIAIAILIWWYFRNGAGAAFVIATLGAYAVSLLYYSIWHEGIFFFVILFGAVLVFQRHPRDRMRVLDAAAQVVLLLLLLRHAQWAFQSLAWDIRWDATGSARAAEFIREHGLDQRRLYGAGAAMVEIQPYFESNIFDNYDNDGRAYWEWSPRNTWPQPTHNDPREMDAWLARLLHEKPEYIVYGSGRRLSSDETVYATRLFRSGEYRRIASFGGFAYWKTRPHRRMQFYVFQRADPFDSTQGRLSGRNVQLPAAEKHLLPAAEIRP